MMVKVFNKVLQVCLSLFFSYMCVYGESAPAVASCTAEKTETVLQMELFQLLSWGIWGFFLKNITDDLGENPNGTQWMMVCFMKMLLDSHLLDHSVWQKDFLGDRRLKNCAVTD